MGTGSRARKAARNRAILCRIFLFAVTALGFSVPAAMAWSLGADPVFENGEPHVAFVTGDGEPLTEPVFNGSIVTPGMTPLVTTLVVKNLGDVAAGYTIDFRSTDEPGRDDFAPHLLLTVRESASGCVVYRGSLNRLRIDSHRVLHPATTDSYIVTVAWPAAPIDDQNQRRVTAFDLVLTA